MRYRRGILAGGFVALAGGPFTADPSRDRLARSAHVRALATRRHSLCGPMYAPWRGKRCRDGRPPRCAAVSAYRTRHCARGCTASSRACCLVRGPGLIRPRPPSPAELNSREARRFRLISATEIKERRVSRERETFARAGEFPGGDARVPPLPHPFRRGGSLELRGKLAKVLFLRLEGRTG